MRPPFDKRNRLVNDKRVAYTNNNLSSNYSQQFYNSSDKKWRQTNRCRAVDGQQSSFGTRLAVFDSRSNNKLTSSPQSAINIDFAKPTSERGNQIAGKLSSKSYQDCDYGYKFDNQDQYQYQDQDDDDDKNDCLDDQFDQDDCDQRVANKFNKKIWQEEPRSRGKLSHCNKTSKQSYQDIRGIRYWESRIENEESVEARKTARRFWQDSLSRMSAAKFNVFSFRHNKQETSKGTNNDRCITKIESVKKQSEDGQDNKESRQHQSNEPSSPSSSSSYTSNDDGEDDINKIEDDSSNQQTKKKKKKRKKVPIDAWIETKIVSTFVWLVYFLFIIVL